MASIAHRLIAPLAVLVIVAGGVEQVSGQTIVAGPTTAELTGAAGDRITVPVGIDTTGAPGINLGAYRITFSWNPATQTAHSRVFVPGMGVPEDPATGSAALGLGVWLVASGLLPGDGRSSYTVRQGIEINRPSSLACTVTAANGTAVGATVAGQVVPVARGEIMVPPFVG